MTWPWRKGESVTVTYNGADPMTMAGRITVVLAHDWTVGDAIHYVDSSGKPVAIPPQSILYVTFEGAP